MKSIIIILLIVIAIAGGIFYYNNSNSSSVEENTSSQNEVIPSQESNEIIPIQKRTDEINKKTSIKGFAFTDKTITIKSGTTIIWTNEDSAGHTVTSDSGNELNSKLLSKGESYSHTFSTPGTYNYHCAPHPSMKGIIIVE